MPCSTNSRDSSASALSSSATLSPWPTSSWPRKLDFFRETPEWEPLTAPHANLRAWLARMNARPSMLATTWERVAEMAEAA